MKGYIDMLLIEPQLYNLLTGSSLPEEVDMPESDRLPGTYVQQAADQLDTMPRFFRRNRHTLTCRACGHRAKYNIGQPLLVHASVDTATIIQQDISKLDVQFPLYFRCGHCNAAEGWDWGERLERALTEGLLGSTASKNDPSMPVNGESRLFDGYKPEWAADGEKRLLAYIEEKPESAFLWYKLAVLYYRGHRADLAAAALEQSVALDPKHTEALYTLAQLLDTVNAEASHDFFQQTLLSIPHYDGLDAETLRDVAAHSLWELETLQNDSGAAWLPSAEAAPKDADTALRDFLALPEEQQKEQLRLVQGEEEKDLSSFYPVAELFLGRHAETLDELEKTNHHLLQPEVVKQRREQRERYQDFRQTGVQLHGDMFSYLIEQRGPRTMRDIGDRLGVPFEDDAVFDKDAIADTGIYDEVLDGRPLIRQYDAQHEEDGNRRAVLDAGLRSHASLYEVTGGSRIDGLVRLRDVFGGGEWTIIDTNFSKSAAKGDILFARLLPFDDFSMTSGVFFLFPEAHRSVIERRVARHKSTAKAFQEAYRLYRSEGYGVNNNGR
ncbi:tetratricopeptide repeat protein [Salibacterium qingdaonense]|nr:hypothetical protein [Salibacterium qingdaonense]